MIKFAAGECNLTWAYIKREKKNLTSITLENNATIVMKLLLPANWNELLCYVVIEHLCIRIM